MTHVSLEVTHLNWLCPQTFELQFQRPPEFDAVPGQKIDIAFQDDYRTYTLVNAPKDEVLAICVRHVDQGRFSPVLARAKKGDHFQASPAFGYFTYQPAQSVAVFVATGTGIAPFVAFARSGVQGFYLLHGVRTPSQLYYRDILEKAALNYTPCFSNKNSIDASYSHFFQGRVTRYLRKDLPKGIYDFYLCGSGEMVADATRIIDQRFEGSKVFVETFY